MVKRILEPEVMDNREEASAYNDMDHSAVNARFAEDLLAITDLGTDWLDIGTGTALIPIELCKRRSDIRIMASDAAYWMLEIARYNLEIHQCTSQIQLHHGDAKKMVFEKNYFDTVFSNSLMHHLPTHHEFIKEMIRVLRPGGVLFLRDLLRPDTDESVEAIVTQYGGKEACGLKMFRDSLYAALKLEEVRELFAEYGIPKECVTQTSDRHWTLAARANVDKTKFEVIEKTS